MFHKLSISNNLETIRISNEFVEWKELIEFYMLRQEIFGTHQWWTFLFSEFFLMNIISDLFKKFDILFFD